MSAQIDPNHLQQFGHIIGVIHSNSTGRSDLAQLFDDRSFFESLRIEPYYRYTAQQVPQAASTLNHLIQTTHSRRLCLVHGDYSPKNILVNNHKLILLDHEVIHFGDPAFDLGFALAHLLSKAHHFPAQRLAFAAATQTFWTSYTNAIQSAPWRTDIESHAAFHAVACLLARVAGRSKLEYLTQEERQKQMNLAIHLLQSRPTSIDELLNRFLSQL